MVAMLIEVGKGKYNAVDVRTFLSSLDPSRTPEMVLPNGLFLVSVEYPAAEIEKEPIIHPQDVDGECGMDGDEERKTKRRKQCT
jgi:tRNA U38,U39,U40 pseudouridine synthase TruA